MCKKRRYIIIKGVEWLYSRLDVIGYTQPYSELMKDIWCNRKVPKELINEIVGDMK